MKYGKFRRGLAALLAAMCLSTGAAAAQEKGYILETAEGACMIDRTGEALGEAVRYSMLYEIDMPGQGIRRFVGERMGEPGCALLDESGKALTEFEYQSFEYCGGVLIFMRKGYCGAMDTDGSILIEAAYTMLIPTGDGTYLAQKTNPYDDLADIVYRIEADGSEQASPARISGGMSPMSEGLCVAMSAPDVRYGYLNAQGEWAIEPRFRWAGAFENGRAMAADEQGAGMIDTAGAWLIEPGYDSISHQGDSLLLASRGNTLTLIHPDTLESVASYTGDGLYGYPGEGGTALIMHDGRGMVIDANGEIRLDVEDCSAVGRWSGMKDHVIVTRGEFGTAGVYLYGLDGQEPAGPYQEIIPLGKVNGEMYYLFLSFEAQRVEYGRGIYFWDEVPGTRMCGVLSPTGEELFRTSAQYIRHAGDDLIFIDRAEGTALADIYGNVIREYALEGMEHGR